MNKKLYILLIFGIILILGGCSTKEKFVKGDMKDDFCGRHINFQFCKCAFHGDFCDSIGMKKKESQKYVNEKYDEWVEEELENWKKSCLEKGGISRGDECELCDDGFVVNDGECVDDEYADEAIVEGDEEDENKGECKYDDECNSICEGNVMWKMACSGRNNECVKWSDTDCSSINNEYGELSFSQICTEGECVTDSGMIEKEKQVLIGEQKMWSQAVKDINFFRADANALMLDTNKNCINGIADMTNLAIVEFATRVGSVLAGGIPDIAKMTQSATDHAAELASDNIKNLATPAADYAGDALKRLDNYAQGEPKEEERKLKPHEYIKLNCDLYKFFIAEVERSDSDLETALENANYTKSLIDALP